MSTNPSSEPSGLSMARLQELGEPGQVAEAM